MSIAIDTVGRTDDAMCVRCGRVTARRDVDGMPWCGGNSPRAAS